MSRGKGHVQSSLEAALAASPHATFTVEELARLVYPGVTVEKRHLVAVSRAINSMKRSDIWPGEWDDLRLGIRHLALYFNRKSKRSIAAAHHRSGEEYLRVQETQEERARKIGEGWARRFRAGTIHFKERTDA
jgi:hypothetical protein